MTIGIEMRESHDESPDQGVAIGAGVAVMAAPLLGIVMTCYEWGMGWEGIGLGMLTLASFVAYLAWGVWLVRWSAHSQDTAAVPLH